MDHHLPSQHTKHKNGPSPPISTHQTQKWTITSHLNTPTTKWTITSHLNTPNTQKKIFNILLQIILKNIHKIFGQIQQTNNTMAY
jgi:hypothetical protein